MSELLIAAMGGPRHHPLGVLGTLGIFLRRKGNTTATQAVMLQLVSSLPLSCHRPGSVRPFSREKNKVCLIGALKLEVPGTPVSLVAFGIMFWNLL